MNLSTPLDIGTPDVVKLHSKRGIDITVAAIWLPLALLDIWCVLFVRITPDIFEDVRGGGVFLLVYSMFGPAGPIVALLLFAVWFASMGLGSAWRALDRRPILVADAQGVTFHPAFFNGFMPRRDIARIGIGGRDPANLDFALHRRIWTVESPWTALRVRLGLNYLGLGTRQARQLVPRLNRLRRAARRASSSSRGPDAAET